MTVWEQKYVVLGGRDDEFSAQLSELGRDGWEVVGFTKLATVGARTTWGVVIKRPQS